MTSEERDDIQMWQQRPDGTWEEAEFWRCLGLLPYIAARLRGEAKCVFCGFRWGLWYGLFGTDAKQYKKDSADVE